MNGNSKKQPSRKTSPLGVGKVSETERKWPKTAQKQARIESYKAMDDATMRKIRVLCNEIDKYAEDSDNRKSWPILTRTRRIRLEINKELRNGKKRK